MKEKEETTIFVAYEDARPLDASEPEKALLVAIIESALSDVQKGGESQKKACEYLLSPDEEYLFSFKSICNFLNLDHQRLLTFHGIQSEKGAGPVNFDSQIEGNRSHPVVKRSVT